MARKELAGLAALGALAMMANRGKKSPELDTSGVQDTDLIGNGSVDSTGGFNNLRSGTSDTQIPMGGGDIGASRMTPASITPRPRPRPRLDTSSVKDMDLTGGARSPSANQDWNKITPQEAERRKKMEADQALVPIRPEEALVGGGGFSGLKTVAALAKGLANRKGAAAAGQKFKDYITPEIGYEPLKLGSEALKLRKNGGAIKMAKGGVTRSSASSRGDGIASKGKTRGRLR